MKSVRFARLDLHLASTAILICILGNIVASGLDPNTTPPPVAAPPREQSVQHADPPRSGSYPDESLLPHSRLGNPLIPGNTSCYIVDPLGQTEKEVKVHSTNAPNLMNTHSIPRYLVKLVFWQESPKHGTRTSKR